MNRRSLLLFMMLLLPAAISFAQVSPSAKSVLSVEGYAQTWELVGDREEQLILEWGTPISLFLPLQEQGEIRVAASGCGYHTNFRRQTALMLRDSSSNLTGLTNFRIEGDWALSPQILLGANFSLPTGRTELDEEELRAIALFMKPELATRVPRPGSGLDFGCQLSAVQELNPSLLGGAAVGYQNRGAYTPHKHGADINPGDEFLMSAAVEFSNGNSKARAALIMTAFSSEKTGDAKHFKSGDKYEILLTGMSRIRQSTFWISLHHIRRNSNRIGTKLVMEPENSHGAYTLLRLGTDVPLSSPFHLLPFLEGRWLGENGYAEGAASVYGGGLEGAFILKSSELRLYFSYYEGETDGGDRTLRGISSGFRFAFAL